uniref:Uncharacterized protein n=1 Tax=Glossina pallidipes TaxID=7398 RepID=A0A1B0A9N2_GLOPL
MTYACQTEQKKHLDRGVYTSCAISWLIHTITITISVGEITIRYSVAIVHLKSLFQKQLSVAALQYLNKTYKYCCTHVLSCFGGEGGLKCLTVGFITSNETGRIKEKIFNPFGAKLGKRQAIPRVA